jgi:tetratricopeptide (TPR) repeat protein
LGAAYVQSGRVPEALPLLEQAVAHAASMREIDFQSHRLACLGEAYLAAGHMDEALAAAVQALEISREHKERGWEAHALRLLSDIAAQRDIPAVQAAEEHYRQALALAEDLGMRPLQAHCHLGLGILYTKIDRREQAHGKLSTAIELFRAMQMTFWLAQVETTLKQTT